MAGISSKSEEEALYIGSSKRNFKQHAVRGSKINQEEKGNRAGTQSIMVTPRNLKESVTIAERRATWQKSSGQRRRLLRATLLRPKEKKNGMPRLLLW